MSTFGALLGASVAGLAFKLSGSNFILTFALASVPALASLLLVSAVGPPPPWNHPSRPPVLYGILWPIFMVHLLRIETRYHYKPDQLASPYSSLLLWRAKRREM